MNFLLPPVREAGIPGTARRMKELRLGTDVPPAMPPRFGREG